SRLRIPSSILTSDRPLIPGLVHRVFDAIAAVAADGGAALLVGRETAVAPAAVAAAILRAPRIKDLGTARRAAEQHSHHRDRGCRKQDPHGDPPVSFGCRPLPLAHTTASFARTPCVMEGGCCDPPSR